MIRSPLLILIVSSLLFPISCGGGAGRFRISGCANCHLENREGVAPSLSRISSAYKGNEEGLNDFLSGRSMPIVEPEKREVMAPQLELTKGWSEEERREVVRFILGH